MVGLFTKSPFRSLLVCGAIVLLGLPPLFSSLVNLWFSRHESLILSAFNEALGVPVEMRRMRYHPLQGIVIEDFVLRKAVDPELPSPIYVKRIYVRPSLTLVPRLGFQLGKVIFEEPSFSLQASIPEMTRIGRFLNAAPARDKRFGLFYFRMRLSSLKIVGGHVTVLSPREARHPFRQEFESVHLLLSRRWFGGERLVLEGHPAGDPEASFHLRAHLKNPTSESTSLDLHLDCQKFAAVYLKPYLGSQIELPDEELSASIHVKVRQGKTFVSKGKLRFQNGVEGEALLPRLLSLIFSSLKYELRGEIEEGRCHLKKLVLQMSGMVLEGTGDIRYSEKASAYYLYLTSGKIPARKLQSLLPQLQIASGQLRFLCTLTGSSAEPLSPYAALILEDCTFHDARRHRVFSKVDGQIRFFRDRLVIDDLWAFWNNFPVRLRGTLSHFDAPRLWAEISTYPGQLSILRPKNPFNGRIRFIGGFSPHGWRGDLWLTHFVYREGEEQEWAFIFHDMTAEDLRLHRFFQDLSEGRKFQSRSFMIRQKGSRRLFDHLAMRKTHFFVSVASRKIQCDLLEGRFGGGALFLQGLLDARQFPHFSWTVTGSLSDVDAKALLSHFEKPYPVTGRLSAEGAWSKQKNTLHFLGRFRFSEGIIGPTVPLQRFADATGIEPLRQIRFHEFAGHVAFQDGVLDINHLKILSDEAELLANVKIEGERLQGSLSARFPEGSIRKSSDLRRLLRYVGGQERVDFDFRVAGLRGVPRLQWLSGEFKRKVETKLSPAMRKQLAKEIERILSERENQGVSAATH